MKLSVASLAASDFGFAHRSSTPLVTHASRPAASSLYDEDEDVPTTLLKPRRKEPKGRAKSRAVAHV
jgi:hypothetical protein